MHSTDHEILEVVDENDTVIGAATRREIHAKGLLHRAAHVFVFNLAGHIYVQKRSASKDRHPLKLDSSAAGHVDPGEAYEKTAVRELGEELDLNASVEEILRVPACAETDGEHVRLFRAVTDKPPRPNPEEILWGAFLSPERLTREMESNPDAFVPAFVLLWHEYLRRNP